MCWSIKRAALLSACIFFGCVTQTIAQTTITTLDDLARLTPGQLDAIYAGANAGSIPAGKVKGLPLVRPGTGGAVGISKSARVFWQGKVFQNESGTAVNRFFGVRVIKGEVGYGTSCRDARPSIILDYGNTSVVYRRYRDEIREVVPGIYLGLMFEREAPEKGPVMYFAFQKL
jgi:hypothetical protein